MKCVLAERLDCGNPALFRADPSNKGTEKEKGGARAAPQGIMKELTKDEA